MTICEGHQISAATLDKDLFLEFKLQAKSRCDRLHADWVRGNCVQQEAQRLWQSVKTIQASRNNANAYNMSQFLMRQDNGSLAVVDELKPYNTSQFLIRRDNGSLAVAEDLVARMLALEKAELSNARSCTLILDMAPQRSRGMDCEVCGAFASAKCALCKKAFYCCKEHQVAHWKEHKKYLCNFYQEFEDIYLDAVAHRDGERGNA
jgi:hypothetical protein